MADKDIYCSYQLFCFTISSVSANSISYREACRNYSLVDLKIAEEITATKISQYGTTVMRTVNVGNKGSISAGFFYKGGT